MSHKKVLMIIAHRNFRDEELLETKQVIEHSGGEVSIASTSTSPATGMFGAQAVPTLLLSDVDVNSYDAVIFVGGGGSQDYFNYPTALGIARDAYEKDKIVCAICIAPVILANAGLLNKKKATVWNGNFITMLQSKGAIYTGSQVTRDGRIITGNGPEAATNFGKAIVEALG